MENVRSIGRKLAVSAFAVLRPASLAQVGDIVAIFKDNPSSDAWRDGYERQVAWTYTSFQHSGASDNSAGFEGMLPGPSSVDHWSHTFMFSSTGPGMYSIKLFSNSSDKSSSSTRSNGGASLDHGAVRAILRFRLLVASCALA